MSMRPAPGMYPVSQGFWGTFSTRFSGGTAHGAIDIACPSGTPILAPDDGVIVFADWAYNLPGGPNDWVSRWYQLKPAYGDTRSGGGIMTVLRNDLGSHWIMAHLSSNNEAPVGKRVRKGDVIGKSGNTGSSTGPHLHLGLIPPNPNWGNGQYGAIDPAGFLTEAYAPNKYVSWTGGATTGTGSTSTAPTEWLAGAIREPQPGGVKLEKSIPSRGVWHITSDVDPGKQQPPPENIGKYLKDAGYCPHLMWDPFTGKIWQYYPASVGSRALAAWNEDGAVNIQIEVVFSRGAYRNGRQYWTVGETPLKGFDQIMQWLDSHSIPRVWPMGTPPALHTNSKRDVGIWNSKAGHYGHVHVPNNDHTDPGFFPDITKVPYAAGRGATTTTLVSDEWSIEELISMSQAQFNKDKKVAGTPAWYLTNDRDRGVNIEKRVRRLEHMEWIVNNDRDRGLNNEKRIISIEAKLDAVLAKLEGK